jgi:hypothetical protein
LLVVKKAELATDFLTDLTDGLLVGEQSFFVVIALAIKMDCWW